MSKVGCDHAHSAPSDVGRAATEAATGQRRALTIPSARVARRQRIHFSLCIAAPILLSVALPAMFPWLLSHGVGIAIGVTMWILVAGAGVSVGFHRLFTHKAFTISRAGRAALGILGSMAAQGPVTYWVALHRLHHARSDGPDDPHSPWTPDTDGVALRSAFWHGHVGWTWRHDLPNLVRFAPDLMEDPQALWLARHYWTWVLLGLAVPSLIGGALLGSVEGLAVGLYWGGVLRVALVHQLIWSVNSVCHRWGSRPHSTGDRSTNNVWLAVPTFGESWHNNHHYRPSSARFGEKWWQLDIGWWMVLAMQAFGIVSRIRGSGQRRAD